MEQSRSTSNQGVNINLHNGQLSVSSGLITFDQTIGGGIPLGTVTLIEEDLHGIYSGVMLRCFLAEGVASNQSVFLASLDKKPSKILQNLPVAVENSNGNVTKSSTQSGDRMRIAFRYEHLSERENEFRTNFGHNFDISKSIPQDTIDRSDIELWNGQECNDTSENHYSFCNPAYGQLLNAIKDRIKNGKFFLKDGADKRQSILRIGIHSMGSGMWLPHSNDRQYRPLEASHDLKMFIFCLRTLVRSAAAVALITIPVHLYQEATLNRCIHSCDIAIRLQVFSGTELEQNRSLSDYHGFFQITKLAAINSLVSRHPGAVEFVFKCKRRKFTIEKLHLPPDVDALNEKRGMSMGCGGLPQNVLDF